MTTYYISPTGDDEIGDGSSGNPWATITGAVNGSSADDTIICQDGIYTHADNFRVDIGDRDVQAENNGLAIFDHNNVVIYEYGVSSFVWKFSGTSIITGIKFYRIPIRKYNYGNANIIEGASSSNITVNLCEFNQCGANAISNVGGGIISNNGASGCTFNITNNLFYKNYNPLTNVEYANAGTAFNFITSGTLNTITFTGNTFYFTTKPASASYEFTYFCGGDRETWSSYIMKNNIFYRDGDALTDFRKTGNDAWDFDNNCNYGGWTDVPSGTGNITSDPLFVDVENENLNLRPSSPCIDTGTLI
jgi:hypothetical protein